MIANDLFEHIKSVSKTREDLLRDEHEIEKARINKKRLEDLELLKSSLNKDLEKEGALLIEKYIREEARKTKAEVLVRKNDLFSQMKKIAKKLALKMDESKLTEIFSHRLRSVKDRISGEVRLVTSEQFCSLAEGVSKKSGIDCCVEIRNNIGDGKLILEGKEITVDLSIDELIETEAERNSGRLYEIFFD